eukprot:Skav224151  [mRNA]  locus=scaffold462:430679:440020:- [translate_table: standard]
MAAPRGRRAVTSLVAASLPSVRPGDALRAPEPFAKLPPVPVADGEDRIFGSKELGKSLVLAADLGADKQLQKDAWNNTLAEMFHLANIGELDNVALFMAAQSLYRLRNSEFSPACHPGSLRLLALAPRSAQMVQGHAVLHQQIGQLCMKAAEELLAVSGREVGAICEADNELPVLSPSGLTEVASAFALASVRSLEQGLALRIVEVATALNANDLTRLCSAVVALPDAFGGQEALVKAIPRRAGDFSSAGLGAVCGALARWRGVTPVPLLSALAKEVGTLEPAEDLASSAPMNLVTGIRLVAVCSGAGATSLLPRLLPTMPEAMLTPNGLPQDLVPLGRPLLPRCLGLVLGGEAPTVHWLFLEGPTPTAEAGNDGEVEEVAGGVEP